MAALNAATLAVSVLIGVTLFEEAISQGGDHLLPAIAGLALAMAGVVILALGRDEQPRSPSGGA